jgi:hypothetical protein
LIAGVFPRMGKHCGELRGSADHLRLFAARLTLSLCFLTTARSYTSRNANNNINTHTTPPSAPGLFRSGYKQMQTSQTFSLTRSAQCLH